MSALMSSSYFPELFGVMDMCMLRQMFVESQDEVRMRSNTAPRITEMKVLNKTAPVHKKLTSLFGNSELRTQCFQ